MINSIFSIFSAVLLILVVHYSLAFWSIFSRSTVFNVNFSFGVFKFCHILKILRNVKKSIWISLFWSTIYFFHILSSISFKYMLSKFSFQYDTLKRYLIGNNWLNWMKTLIVNWTNWVNFAVLDLILIALLHSLPEIIVGAHLVESRNCSVKCKNFFRTIKKVVAWFLKSMINV